MTPCMCLVQEGQLPPKTEASLRSGLEALSQRAFGISASINWITVPENSGFTAAKPSTSAIVSMQADKPLDQNTRVSLLKDICELWMRETQCSMDEIVASVTDPE